MILKTLASLDSNRTESLKYQLKVWHTVKWLSQYIKDVPLISISIKSEEL